MKKFLLIFTLTFLYCFFGKAQNILPAFTAEADAFLKKYVADGKVDYSAVQKDAKAIALLTNKIGSINLPGASDMNKKAFYLNAYNLLVIQAVANQFPIKSVMDKPGFFDKVTYLVAGEKLTLNDLENKKLLQPYPDARLHFALACAAVSCPPLANFAYTPEELNHQLEDRTRLALNNNAFIRISKKDKKVQLSKIFDWYKPDFAKENQTVRAFINKYRTDKIPADYQLGYYEYDWRLNNQ